VARRQTGVTEKDFELHGIIQSGPQNKLFLADAHESALVERLHRFLKLRFIGGAAMIALATMLTAQKFYIQEFRRGPAAVNEIDTHNSKCLAGQSASCALLIENRFRFKLKKDEVEFYSQKACEFGKQRYCP
jgi:hypothetical protein